jgi:2-isopropylmalate synthase
MTPQSVGILETQIVLGKHSGRHAIANRLKEMGYVLVEEEINKIFVRFKELADIKKEVFDEDLDAIVYEETSRQEEKYRFVYLNVVSGNAAVPTATMQMEVDGQMVQEAGFGVGPVDATFAAIRKITQTSYPLLKFAVTAVTGGTDAQGEATVQLNFNGRSALGRGAHPDILVASAKAYINALNRLEWLSKEGPKAASIHY